MNVLAVISPGLKILFERVGRPEVINRPDFFRFDGTGASPAITLAGRTAYGWRKLSTQDSCAICQSRSCSVRRCHDGSWSTAHRPPVQVTFGSPIPTAKLPIGKTTTISPRRCGCPPSRNKRRSDPASRDRRADRCLPSPESFGSAG